MIYDYKSEELTQEVYIQCICPLCDDIIDEYSTLRRYENLSIYAPSYIAREILGRLLDEIEDLWVGVDSENELLYKDNNEVLVTRVDGVIKSNEDSCLTYFYDGLNSKDLSILEENAESILVFGFEEDTCEGCKSEDSNVATTDKSQYYVNGKEVSRQTWEKEQKLINDTIEAFRRDFWDNWLDF